MPPSISSLPIVTKVLYRVSQFEIFAYHLEAEIHFIHSQIANPIGRKKGSAQQFCAKRKTEFPDFREAIDLDKDHSILLSSLDAAHAYWQWQAKERKNFQAQELIAMLARQPLQERTPELISNNSNGNGNGNDRENKQIQRSRTLFELLNTNKSKLSEPEIVNSFDPVEQKLELITTILQDAGLDDHLIAQYKLNAIAAYFPELKDASEDAKKWLATFDPHPCDLINVTALTRVVSQQLDRTIKPTEINQALVELGFQFPVNERGDRRLSPLGKKYGRTLILTGINNHWSGTQIYWDQTTIAPLIKYFTS